MGVRQGKRGAFMLTFKHDGWGLDISRDTAFIDILCKTWTFASIEHLNIFSAPSSALSLQRGLSQFC